MIMERQGAMAHRLYPERPGIGLEGPINQFQANPEFQLAPEQETRVRAFETTLTRGENLYPALLGVNELTLSRLNAPAKKFERYTVPAQAEGLEKIWGLKVNTSSFAVEYFLSGDGRKEFGETFGINPDELGLNTVDGMRGYLYGVDYGKIDAKALDKLAGNSTMVADKAMVSQFEKNGFTTLDGIKEPEIVIVVQNPEVLAEKIAKYRQLKNFHRDYARKLEGKKDPESQAVQVVLKIHQRRLNQLLAEEYPLAAVAHTQLKAASNAHNEQVVQILGGSVRALEKFTGKESARLFARLDRYTEGAGDFVGEGNKRDRTVLSTQALELALVDQGTKQSTTKEITDYRYKYVDKEKLKQTIIGTDEFIGLAKKSVAAVGLLSAQEQYDPRRPGWASDNKVQVIEDPNVKNLSFDPRQGVYRVPSNLDRPISSITPAGAIPANDHEQAHMWRHYNKARLGLAITDRVGMDRFDINAEAGAIAWETEAQKKLFGQDRPTNPHYLRAVQAKLAGGSLKDTAKAFYDSVMQQDPKGDKRKAAELAFNRAGRLFRRGGKYSDNSRHLTNSQPLVYLEQEILAQELSAKGLSNLLMIGGVNIEMLAELKRVGLLDLSKVTLPEKRPSEILEEDIIKRLAS